MEPTQSDFVTVDRLAKEYGWSIEYIQGLQVEEINNLIEAINSRQRQEYKFLVYIINCAMNGKMPKFDSDNSNEPPRDETAQLLGLMKEINGKVHSPLERK